MLVLKRKNWQWVEIVHHTGDILKVRVYSIEGGSVPSVKLAFDDDDRNFEIARLETKSLPRPGA